MALIIILINTLESQSYSQSRQQQHSYISYCVDIKFFNGFKLSNF